MQENNVLTLAALDRTTDRLRQAQGTSSQNLESMRTQTEADEMKMRFAEILSENSVLRSENADLRAEMGLIQVEIQNTLVKTPSKEVRAEGWKTEQSLEEAQRAFYGVA